MVFDLFMEAFLRREKFVNRGEVDIFAESFGDEGNPAIVLVMGATAQGLMWKDEFCTKLAEVGFLVIRYDHRDTGKSSRIDYSKNPYYLHDLAKDAVAVLKSFGKEKAVWIGASMGSFLCKMIAIYDPALVAKLVLVMSTPNHLVFVEGFYGRDTEKFGLPASNPNIMTYYQAILSITSRDPEDAEKKYRHLQNLLIGAPEHLVETRIFEGRILKRLKSKYHIHNHAFALANSKDLHNELPRINCPTLIIHGAEDYILPVEHGRLLAKLIKTSKYIEYDHMGHCFTKKINDRFLADLEEFLK